MAVYTLDAGNLTQWAFNSDACRSKSYDAVTQTYKELATGDWKVTIENTSGDLWESNEVTVVYYGEAIMSDVSIEDDYETANMAGVALAKETGTAILNVTFNKNYAGTLYLIDSKIEKGYTGHDTNKINLGGTGKSIESYLAQVKTKAQLTNKNATAAKGAGAKAGIYWEDATGAVHCKLPVALTAGKTVTRGSSYYLVWDQDDNDADDFKAASSKREDLNASEDMEVPYVVAPDSIVVSSFASGATAVKVDLLDADGEKLAWYTGATTLATAGLDSAKIFKVDTNAKSADDSFVNVDGNTGTTIAGKDGTLTLTAGAAIANKYVYVKLATKAGIFAKESITLESDLSESARDALDSMSMKEDSTDPTAAVVEFKGLSSKAPGKVYIMQGNKNAADGTGEQLNQNNDTTVTDAEKAVAYKNIAGHGLDDAIASADVDGGAASVTIPGVFEADDMDPTATTYGQKMGNDAFVAVFVPEDEELWKRADSRALNAAGTDLLGFQLSPTITTIDKSGLTAAFTAKGTSPEITIAGIQALDQFGNKWIGDNRTTDTAKVDVTNKTVTNTEAGTATTSTAGTTGIVTIVATLSESTTHTWDKGDGVTIKVAALKDLAVTITAKDKVEFLATGLDVGVTGTATVEQGATLTTPATSGGGKLSTAFSIS